MNFKKLAVACNLACLLLPAVGSAQQNAENQEPLVTFESLYIVTLQNGHWGVKARSSLAPR